ncbi:hypothetical protein V8C37DRAFT_387227 [Trichoderma ceciliae]
MNLISLCLWLSILNQAGYISSDKISSTERHTSIHREPGRRRSMGLRGLLMMNAILYFFCFSSLFIPSLFFFHFEHMYILVPCTLYVATGKQQA